MHFNFRLEEIKYVKITYKDINNRSFTHRAALKRIDEKEIILCTKYEDSIKISTPQTITLSIVCEEGLYKTKTQLLSYENTEPYFFFVLQRPENLEYQQNREYFRVPAKYSCRYSINGRGEFVSYNATTYDISANGVCINLPNLHISENEDAKLSLFIDGREVSTKVKYVRSEKVNEGYKMSFYFSKIAEQDRDFISQACIKKQLEEKRKRSLNI